MRFWIVLQNWLLSHIYSQRVSVQSLSWILKLLRCCCVHLYRELLLLLCFLLFSNPSHSFIVISRYAHSLLLQPFFSNKLFDDYYYWIVCLTSDILFVIINLALQCTLVPLRIHLLLKHLLIGWRFEKKRLTYLVTMMIRVLSLIRLVMFHSIRYNVIKWVT